MLRSDFDAIAKAIGQNAREHNTNLLEVASLAKKIADYIVVSHPNFDRDKFMTDIVIAGNKKEI